MAGISDEVNMNKICIQASLLRALKLHKIAVSSVSL